MPSPKSGDYGAFYANYVALTSPANSVNELINFYAENIINFYTSIPEKMANYSYADGKWTVKQLIQHVIDTERIFCFRAVTFSRKDNVALLGFNENNYAENADAAHRTSSDLLIELTHLRKSTDCLLQSFTTNQLQYMGVASENGITVNALCFIIYGHLLHHKNILEAKYFPTFASSI